MKNTDNGQPYPAYPQQGAKNAPENREARQKPSSDSDAAFGVPAGRDNYEDILYLPHHVSPTRPPMSMHDRAAQFSPFAALTGFEEMLKT